MIECVKVKEMYHNFYLNSISSVPANFKFSAVQCDLKVHFPTLDTT